MVNSTVLQPMREGTSELIPTVRGHSLGDTIEHEPVVVNIMSQIVRTFIRHGSEFCGFGQVCHHQAYDHLCCASYGEGGLGAPSPSVHRLGFDMTQRERPSQADVNRAKGTAHTWGTSFRNVLQLEALAPVQIPAEFVRCPHRG